MELSKQEQKVVNLTHNSAQIVEQVSNESRLYSRLKSYKHKMYNPPYTETSWLPYLTATTTKSKEKKCCGSKTKDACAWSPSKEYLQNQKADKPSKPDFNKPKHPIIKLLKKTVLNELTPINNFPIISPWTRTKRSPVIQPHLSHKLNKKHPCQHKRQHPKIRQSKQW